MELPITVIVVLFVAVVVGGSMLYFSQQNLHRAQEVLNTQFGSDDVPQDGIIRVDVASKESIVALAEQCITQKTGTVDGGVCFALFADEFPAFSTFDDLNISQGFTLDTSGAVQSSSAVEIIYDPIGIIRVTS